MKQTFTIIAIVLTSISMAQSKKELRKQIEQLKNEKATTELQVKTERTEKETIKAQIDRISNIEIDEVITPDEQPAGVKIGEEGWRVDLNGTKYKSDILGQLGTIWVLDSNNQLQPQGAISLSDYKIDPTMISESNDILYKKFISKGTTLQGDGGASFVQLTADMKNDQFSSFTISIDGTSLIKPKPSDIQAITKEVNHLFNIPNSKGVFICTGMHVVRYYARIFSRSDVTGKITSPVVNIGGSFYAESNEESKQFFVARQVTQLFLGLNKTTSQIIQEITNLLNQPVLIIKSATKNYSPNDLLTYLLKRQPTNEEIVGYQGDPEKFIKNNELVLTDKEKILLQGVNNKITELPKMLNSM